MIDKLEWYDNSHMKTKEKRRCIMCEKRTDRLDVLSESYVCSKECDNEFNTLLDLASGGE